jgi:hypothetical protein
MAVGIIAARACSGARDASPALFAIAHNNLMASLMVDFVSCVDHFKP